MKRNNWKRYENEILCHAYRMLSAAQANGERLNKAALCRAVLPELDNRTRGSYEMKLMNLSAYIQAVMPDHVVKGYKPHGHAQKDLADTYRATWGGCYKDEFSKAAIIRINEKVTR